MDSKLRRTAILASMAVILLTSLLVLYSSWREGSGSENNGYGISSQSTPSQENQGGEEGGLAQQETGTDSEQSSGQIGDDLSAFLRDAAYFILPG